MKNIYITQSKFRNVCTKHMDFAMTKQGHGAVSFTKSKIVMTTTHTSAWYVLKNMIYIYIFTGLW